MREFVPFYGANAMNDWRKTICEQAGVRGRGPAGPWMRVSTALLATLAAVACDDEGGRNQGQNDPIQEEAGAMSASAGQPEAPNPEAPNPEAPNEAPHKEATKRASTDPDVARPGGSGRRGASDDEAGRESIRDASAPSDGGPAQGSDSNVADRSGEPGAETPDGESKGREHGPSLDAMVPADADIDASVPPMKSGRDAGRREPYTGIYTDEAKWTCRPGMADNPCEAELSVTEVMADGTTVKSALPQMPAEVRADCFYVYPTVDPGLLAPPRNLDFPQIDRAPVLAITSAQAIPFRQLCNLYAPVYRQASLNTFGADPSTRDRLLDVSFSDIEDAFEFLLADTPPDRPIILVTHSQGARGTLRLMQRRLVGDPAVRERLVVAILAGPLGGFSVPRGQRVGGSLEDVPLCSTQEETGCVLTHNSFWDGAPPNDAYADISVPFPEGHDVGCNPGFYDSQQVHLSGALFHTTNLLPPPLGMFDFGSLRIDTDYVRFADFYTGQCLAADDGLSYLSISVDPLSGDTRNNPVVWNSLALADRSAGLHTLDYAFVMAELIEAARVKLATKLAERP